MFPFFCHPINSERERDGFHLVFLCVPFSSSFRGSGADVSAGTVAAASPGLGNGTQPRRKLGDVRLGRHATDGSRLTAAHRHRGGSLVHEGWLYSCSGDSQCGHQVSEVSRWMLIVKLRGFRKLRAGFTPCGVDEIIQRRYVRYSALSMAFWTLHRANELSDVMCGTGYDTAYSSEHLHCFSAILREICNISYG